MGRDQAVRTSLIEAVPAFWLRETEPTDVPDAAGHAAVLFAVAHWRRFAGALASLFSADLPDGIIASPLRQIRRLVAELSSSNAPAELGRRVFVKCDHCLPLTGSIKARGGVYEVLRIAERRALRSGILRPDADYGVLSTPAARGLFATQKIVVGSTGNLGYAVGRAARALGFRVDVHMSRDAKPWKKQRLTGIGAAVIEHAADYSSAVAAARGASETESDSFFIDDERSPDLFFGYSAAAAELAGQLQREGVRIDADHPLCVYLPCGVGGAPAGVLYGLRALLGPHVWGFLAEPTAAPCMMLRLIGMPAAASVYDLGLDNRTIADGLAVARASDYAYQMIASQVMGAYTVTDAQMLAWVAGAASDELRLEPAAAAGFAGALHAVWQLPTGPLTARLARATHIVWTTGGSLLPDAGVCRSLVGGFPMNPRWTRCLASFGLVLGALTVRAKTAEDALRTELTAGLARGMPSISFAIATRQGVIWSGAVGYADLPSRSLAHAGYLYGIGSITKMFVACVIEQLVDEGRLSLECRPGRRCSARKRLPESRMRGAPRSASSWTTPAVCPAGSWIPSGSVTAGGPPWTCRTSGARTRRSTI